MKISATANGLVTFSFEEVSKGMWSWPSPLGTPEGLVPLMQNLDLPGGMPTSMLGDAIFIDSAFDAASTVTLATTRFVTGGDPTPVIATSNGKVFHYIGGNWVLLRDGFSTAAGIWWSDEQYGDDLYISNPTDGVWRYDGAHLVPVGAKIIAMAESDEAADWTNETADTTNFKEGTQSFKVACAQNANATLTYNPSAAIDTATGRIGAKTYSLTKAVGTDAYHFWVRFSAGATANITAGTTTVVITDTNAKTLTWDTTKWRSTKSATATAIPINDNNWHEVWLFPSDATESATFNPTIVDKIDFKVTCGAGSGTDMNIDDVYSIYLQTMPAVQIVKEWKNMLFGFNEDNYYFSKVAAPDEFHTLATATFKSGGENVNGVARFYNQLTIGTDSHIFTLSGSTQGSTYPAYLFDSNEVTDEIGCSSHRSIVKADNMLFWLWNGHIVIYNGTKADHISYPIDTVMDELDWSKAQFFVGAPFRRKHEVWWTLRRTNQSVNDLVVKFDHNWKAFIRVEGLTTPVCFKTKVSGEEKFLTINESSRKIYVQNYPASYSFSGTAISYILELPAMTIPGMSLQWVQNWLQYLNNTGNVLVQYRHGDTLRALQQASYETAETVAMNVDGEYGKMRLGERAQLLQVRFSSSGVKMELQPPFIIVARQQAIEFVRNTP